MTLIPNFPLIARLLDMLCDPFLHPRFGYISHMPAQPFYGCQAQHFFFIYRPVEQLFIRDGLPVPLDDVIDPPGVGDELAVMRGGVGANPAIRDEIIHIFTGIAFVPFIITANRNAEIPVPFRWDEAPD